MRIAFVLPLVLAGGLALPAVGQPAAHPADARAQVSTATPSSARAKEQEEQAAAALAMSIRQREIEEQRIARIACAAGDASKCQTATTLALARTPSP